MLKPTLKIKKPTRHNNRTLTHRPEEQLDTTAWPPVTLRDFHEIFILSITGNLAFSNSNFQVGFLLAFLPVFSQILCIRSLITPAQLIAQWLCPLCQVRTKIFAYLILNFSSRCMNLYGTFPLSGISTDNIPDVTHTLGQIRPKFYVESLQQCLYLFALGRANKILTGVFHSTTFSYLICYLLLIDN